MINKKQFYKKFVAPKSGLRATSLNNEEYVMGKASEIWEFIEKVKEQAFKEALEAGYDKELKTYSPDDIFDWLKKEVEK